MKKVTASILTLVLLYPAIASAAWWNPLSWSIFHKHVEPVVMQEPVTLPAPFPTSIVEPVASAATNEKQVEKEVVKQSVVPVVKTVDNSAVLKAQQDKLAAQAILDQKNAEQLAAQQKADQAFLDEIQKETEEQAKNAPINSPECKTAQQKSDKLSAQMNDDSKTTSD